MSEQDVSIESENREADQTCEQSEQQENEFILQRKQKLAQLREQGNAYPNDFRRDHLAATLHAEYGEQEKETLAETKIPVKVAGRMVAQRLMGKASFIQLQDMSGRIQAYLRRDDLPEGDYAQFKTWDLGDIVGVEGYLFKTKTGELSVHAESIRLLTKSLRPLPEKFHGLTDQEIRYRQRYLDLIANENVRETFLRRAKITDSLRRYLNDEGFMEVETPMMQAIPGGAAAKPFTTHHNALNMSLYLRISPELYLKRLVVGGFERVYEINRNFRNEGLSTRHNPEFTMIEFYQAYADYEDAMNLTEALIRAAAQDALGTLQLTYQGTACDLSQPFARMSVTEAIAHYNDEISIEDLNNIDAAKKIANAYDISIEDSAGLGKIQLEIFDKTTEDKLIAPTFITEYPTEVSPLARCNNDNPFITDRFELFIAGRELANGFSELNDPEDQAERFRQQAAEKEAGDEEAMHYDSDYITALEYGMPPAAGVGIGIDRLVMLLTDSPSIRDVLLFPLMKPRKS